jgi:hypothetical protein
MSTSVHFVQNLQKLKKVSAWAKNCRLSIEKDLKLAKKDLEELYDCVKEGVYIIL